MMCTIVEYPDTYERERKSIRVRVSQHPRVRVKRDRSSTKSHRVLFAQSHAPVSRYTSQQEALCDPSRGATNNPTIGHTTAEMIVFWYDFDTFCTDIRWYPPRIALSRVHHHRVASKMPQTLLRCTEVISPHSARTTPHADCGLRTKSVIIVSDHDFSRYSHLTNI